MTMHVQMSVSGVSYEYSELEKGPAEPCRYCSAPTIGRFKDLIANTTETVCQSCSMKRISAAITKAITVTRGGR